MPAVPGGSYPINKLDPVLVRRIVKQLTNQDVGSNPQYMDLVSLLSGTGVLPVIPLNTPGNEALQVYPRGWWAGGTIDAIGNSGTPQSQTIFALTTGVNAGQATGDHNLHTVTSGKTFYATHVSYAFTTACQLSLKDGSTVLWNDANTGGASSVIQSHNFPIVPLAFSTNVQFNTQAGGTINGSVNIFGYEQ